MCEREGGRVSECRELLDNSMEWCTRNHLPLNVNKTRWWSIFGRTGIETEPINIRGEESEIVELYKSLALCVVGPGGGTLRYLNQRVARDHWTNCSPSFCGDVSSTPPPLTHHRNTRTHFPADFTAHTICFIPSVNCSIIKQLTSE